MSRITIPLGIALMGLSAVAAAQSPESGGPPPVLAIQREEIKPGRMAAHEKLNAAFVAAVSRTPLESRWIGLVPVSGDDNATLFLTAYANFADVETQRKAEEAQSANATFRAELEALEKQNGGADIHASQRTMYARYRPDLSFHPGTMEDAAQARYFGVTTVRVKYNRIPDYVEYMKLVNAAREKAQAPIKLTAYQVMTGGQAGTFVIFRALKSLKTWDDDQAAMAESQKAMTEAYGGEEAARKVRLQGADLVISSDNAVYALNPTISRPSPEFAKYDLAFWTPKPADTRTAAAKPGATKQPASAKKDAPKP